MTADDLTHEEKCALFTMGAMHALAAEGMVKMGNTVQLTDVGIALFDQLKATGFRPLVDEQRQCLLHLMANDVASKIDDSEEAA